MLATAITSPAHASADWLDRVESLVAAKIEAPAASVQEFVATTWTVEGGDELPRGSEFPGWAGIVDAGSHGGYLFAVVLFDQPTVTIMRQVGDQAHHTTWVLEAGDPDAPVVDESDFSLSSAQSCEAVFIGASIGTTVACVTIALIGTGPASPVAVLVCGALAIVFTLAPSLACRINDDEAVSASLSCDFVGCDIRGQVRTYRPARTLNLSAFWDRDPDPGIIGTVPCYPACGDYSWTLHELPLNHVATLWSRELDPYVEPRELRVYEFEGRLNGKPDCWVDWTKAVWVTMQTSGTWVRGDVNTGSKPYRFCDYSG